MKQRVTGSWFRLLTGISIAAILTGGRGVRAADCNSNGIDDLQDISNGTSRDCNANARPDECDLEEGGIAYEVRDPLPTGGHPHSLLAQDFDGDGDPDLMVSELRGVNWHEGQPEVHAILYFRNLGLGRFDEPVRYETVEHFTRLFARDLHGDADADVLVISRSSVGVLLNRGDGSFEGPAAYSVGWRPNTLSRDITADLDGDHDLDVVISSPEGISILRNRGDGSFEPEERVAVELCYYFELADLDADGDVDIAVDTATTLSLEEGTLVVLKNDGHGSFPDRDVYPLGTFLSQIAASDLDGDNDIDLVVAKTLPSELAVLTNRGDGRFDLAAPLDHRHVPGEKRHVSIADVDGDGDADVLSAADYLAVPGSRQDIVLFLNQGRGSFAAGVPLRVGVGPPEIEVRDLNGDGQPEIISMNDFSGDLTVLRNLGGGAFEEGVQFTIVKIGAASMNLVDLDGDGDLDVASVRGNDLGGLYILENRSGGSFTGGCNQFKRGDVNSDGEVSIADVITLRRFLYEGSFQATCHDAADASDNDELDICDAVVILETLFRNPGWQHSLPAPSPDAGEDPTPLAEPTYPCDLSGNIRATSPIGCKDYQVQPPEPTEDILRVGDAQGTPGQVAKIPIHLTASMPVDAIQVVLSYDPAVLEPVSDGKGVTFESTYLERFETPFGILSAHPEDGIIVAALAVDVFQPGAASVEPGEDLLVGWINVRVLPDAPLGEIDLEPTNGPDGLGVGPYRLRNEITYQGAALFVSFIPQTVGGRLGIVGDQSLFIRGDANGDRMLDISDPIAGLAWLFLGSAQLECEDAADANDDGALDLTDTVFTLGYLFLDARKLPAPFPGLGTDPTADSLECEAPGTER